MPNTSSPATPAVEMTNVSPRFVTPDRKSMTAIRDFNMTIERGEFVAFSVPCGH